MIILELFDNAPAGYQDMPDDNSPKKLHDLRKTKLTLRQINKLRRMHDVRTYEKKQKLAKIRKQYAQPAPEGGGMPGM